MHIFNNYLSKLVDLQTHDPELEDQINDRISFKKLLGLSLDKPSPFQTRGLSRPAANHSTFSRFRSRLSKEAMIQLNNVVVQEFARRGLSILMKG